ncbi:BA75_02228T0 [Komagataella pastoris]|uniref:BA75_02228T0 n=1 Tax=Komagataella pastoris TaxID=4922 RepID=A0A1B2JCZ6_PICPA|nr:BA75_02228T0 [Komagataella pastoris]
MGSEQNASVVTPIIPVDYRLLKDKILQTLEANGKHRILVMLVGPPGSGKSTIAERLRDDLNSMHQELPSNWSTNAGESQLAFSTSLSKNRHHVTDDIVDNVPPSSSVRECPAQNHRDSVDINGCYKDVDSDKNVVISGKSRNLSTIKILASPVTGGKFSQVVPMDGFHLPLEVLPSELLPIRGSPETFDVRLLVKLIELLIETCKTTTADSVPNILVPSFDHAVKDPVPDSILLSQRTRVIIIEGLYLQCKFGEWSKINQLVEKNKLENGLRILSWQVRIDANEARERVARRHLENGLVSTLQEGLEKYDFNDRINGDFIKLHQVPTDLIIDNSDRKIGK